MIYVGLDDTDTLDHPGTNQLARHLARSVERDFHAAMIVRHQLLEDPRVPCTKRNGCASILFEPRSGASAIDLVGLLRPMILEWCPAGSDPGLCVAAQAPPSIVEWGARCQREFVTQLEARRLAAEKQVHLEGLGGTQDGVIGALAAVGLIAGGNDGRIIYFASSEVDWYDVSGPQSVEALHALGVAEIRSLETDVAITSGVVDVGKRLRPNLRNGRPVLYVTDQSGVLQAARLT
jgi:hypothetical protein